MVASSFADDVIAETPPSPGLGSSSGSGSTSGPQSHKLEDEQFDFFGVEVSSRVRGAGKPGGERKVSGCCTESQNLG